MMALIIIGFLGVILLIILILFSFPRFSPIPYFPTNKKDLPLIIKSLNLKNNQTVFDLGAGDGVVIFSAAQKAFERKLITQFIAVDINPVLILIMLIRRFFHPNKNNIKILWDDLFKMNYSHLTTNYNLSTTIYLYLSPWLLEKTIKNIKKIDKKVRIVSYMYPIKSLEKKEIILKGYHSVFVYNI